MDKIFAKRSPKHRSSLDKASITNDASEMDRLLAQLSPKPRSSLGKTSITNDILTKLSEQQILLDKQQELLTNNVRSAIQEDGGSSAASPLTPATGSFASVDNVHWEGDGGDAEVRHLREQLLAANSRIALQEQELAQTRVIKHTIDQALGTETDFGGRDEQTISNMQNVFTASARAFNQRPDSWNVQEDARSDVSDALSAGAGTRARGLWGPCSQQAFGFNINMSNGKGYHNSPTPPTVPMTQDTGHNWPAQSAQFAQSAQPAQPAQNLSPAYPNHAIFQPHRILSGPSSPGYNFDTRYTGEQSQHLPSPNLGPRRSITQVNRGGSCFPPQNSPWGTFAAGAPSGVGTGPPNQPLNTYQRVYPVSPYQPRPIGTPLSPTAAEFTSGRFPWSPPVGLHHDEF